MTYFGPLDEAGPDADLIWMWVQGTVKPGPEPLKPEPEHSLGTDDCACWCVQHRLKREEDSRKRKPKTAHGLAYTQAHIFQARIVQIAVGGGGGAYI